MIENLTRIQVGGTWYLGVLDKDTLTVMDAVECKNTIGETIHSWIQHQNFGSLCTIQLGAHAGYTCKPLLPDAQIILKAEWERMKEIRRTAIHRLENKYFRDDH